MLEDEESKLSLKFHALVTDRWKPGACPGKVEEKGAGYGGFGVRLADLRWQDTHVKMEDWTSMMSDN